MHGDALEDEYDGPAIYEDGEERRRRIRRRCFAGVAAVVVIIVVIVSCVTATRRRSSASNTSRLFEFKIGNLDGDASQVGTFIIRSRPEWAPLGVDRFHDLIGSDFLTDCRFFRVLPGFVAQFGINGDPSTEQEWNDNTLQDDPVVGSNVKGTITFATAGENSRTTQLFINLEDNVHLDESGFAPIGEVVQGMDIVERIYSQWKEQLDQRLIINQGNKYLENFPGLSYIIAVTPSVP